MNDPRSDAEMEQALTAWAEDVAPKTPPTRLLESTFVRTMGTKQARVYPWDRLMPGRRGLTIAAPSARLAIALMVLLIVLALGAGFAGGAFGPKATPSPTPAPTTSPTAAPSLPAATAVVSDGSVAVEEPIAMVTDGESIWILAAGGRIDRIDPTTRTVVDSLTFDPEADLYNGLAFSPSGLWATDWHVRAVRRVDPKPLALAATVPAGSAPKGVLANSDGVWVADTHGGAVLRLDPATNRVVDTISVGPIGASGPNRLADGLGTIWTTVPNISSIVRVDPITKSVQATIDAPIGFTPCGGMVIAYGAAWVSACDTGKRLARADATSNTVVATIDLHGNGFTPALINGSVWISVDGGDATSGTLVRIDPATNTIDRVLVPTIDFGGGGDIVAAAGSVWVVDGYHNSVIRLPLTAFAP